MQRVYFVRHLEQDIAAMLFAARFGERGPGGITRGHLDWLQPFAFVLQPHCDVLEETALAQGLAEHRLQFTAQARAVNRLRLLRRDAADSPLLNKLAFESEERGQGVMPRLQRLDFLRNSKQVAQEI